MIDRLHETDLEVVQDYLIHGGKPKPKTPKESLLGLWKDLGPGPSDEDFVEMRRELWGSSPGRDV